MTDPALPPGKALEPLDERGRMTSAACDDEDGVVAADRADRFRQLRAVERGRERLGLADARADDDELLHVLDAPEEFAGGALERGERRLRIRRLGVRPLIGAVAGALHEAELLDVP